MEGHRHSESDQNLKVAFFLNLGFSLIEIVGGILTNSIAIITDALHDAGDSISLGLAWYFEKLSRKGRTAEHSFGYRRFRLLGGLITGVMLVISLGFILVKAIERLFVPEPVHAPGMILLAILGIIVNGAAVLRVKKGTSLTEKVVSWHLLEDTLGWIVVFIGAVIMMLGDFPIIDPLLSIALSLFVLWNVARNLKEVIKVFLQVTPPDFDLQEFEKTIVTFPKVLSSHHTHCWTLDGESHVFSTHLLMEANASREEITVTKQHAADLLDPHHFEHITIEIELEGEKCHAHDEH